MKRGPIRYFVRDDDVGELTDPLKFFIEACVARGIPVSYQIIPNRLTDSCAQYLRSIADIYPGMIEFGQHGFRHEMTKRGKQLKREFGNEKTYSEQIADINRGRTMLRERLGEDVSVFTPPQHKYNADTVLAAAAAGLKIFSAASYPTLRHQLAYSLGRRFQLSSFGHQGVSYHAEIRPEANLRELSIAVAVDDGRGIRTPPRAIGSALTNAFRYTDIVGLMFHHQVYVGLEARLQLSLLLDQLAEIGPKEFFLLEQVAKDDRAPLR